MAASTTTTAVAAAAGRSWRVLIAHGAGMCVRGKVDIEKFGPLTLPEIEKHIQGYGEQLGLNLEIVTTNTEGVLVDKIYEAFDEKDAVVINPASFTAGYRALSVAVRQVKSKIPIVEVHFSNPASNGLISEIAPSATGLVHGFGIYTYFLALSAIKHQLDSKSQK